MTLRIDPHAIVPEDGAFRLPVELGQLTVPENRSDPGSGTVDLAFARLRTTAANPEPPVVFLAGDPAALASRTSSGTSRSPGSWRWPSVATCSCWTSVGPASPDQT